MPSSSDVRIMHSSNLVEEESTPYSKVPNNRMHTIFSNLSKLTAFFSIMEKESPFFLNEKLDTMPRLCHILKYLGINRHMNGARFLHHVLWLTLTQSSIFSQNHFE